MAFFNVVNYLYVGVENQARKMCLALVQWLLSLFTVLQAIPTANYNYASRQCLQKNSIIYNFIRHKCSRVTVAL